MDKRMPSGSGGLSEGLRQEIACGAELLRAGRLVAFPTETVYGLGGNATNDRAVAAIFAAKGRPTFNPLIVHVAETDRAAALGRFSETAMRLAQAFWPGPLTLVVPRSDGCPISLLASAGLDTLALRVPAHAVARALLAAADLPIAAPSANVSGAISPTTADHVRKGLGDKVDFVIDGGPCPIGLESTIVDCTGDEPAVLRFGGLARSEIETALGTEVAFRAAAAMPSAPGQLESHYAPKARLRLGATAVEPGEALLAFGSSIPDHDGPMLNLSEAGDIVEAAANLFAHLHALDASGAEWIAVMPVPDQGLGEAINDRLTRAAAPRDA